MGNYKQTPRKDRWEKYGKKKNRCVTLTDAAWEWYKTRGGSIYLENYAIWEYEKERMESLATTE